MKLYEELGIELGMIWEKLIYSFENHFRIKRYDVRNQHKKSGLMKVKKNEQHRYRASRREKNL